MKVGQTYRLINKAKFFYNNTNQEIYDKYFHDDCYTIKNVDSWGDAIEDDGMYIILNNELKWFELVQPQEYPNKKHIHHDLIIAWAKGAGIEFLHSDEWMAAPTPNWDIHKTYRIAPTKKQELQAQIAELEAQKQELQKELNSL